MYHLAKLIFVGLLNVLERNKRRLQKYKLLRKHNLTILFSIKNSLKDK